MAYGSVNVPGGSTQGADGKSAYEVAIANGFSGTEAQWLASLKGETGATGATGGIGATGPAGPGLPPGGTAGQVPVKVDGTDYNTQWKKLTVDDVGAAREGHTHSNYLPSDNLKNNSGVLTVYGLRDTFSEDCLIEECCIALGSGSARGYGTIACDATTANEKDVNSISSFDFSSSTIVCSSSISDVKVNDNCRIHTDKFGYMARVIELDTSTRTIKLSRMLQSYGNPRLFISAVGSGRGSNGSKGALAVGSESLAVGSGVAAIGKHAEALKCSIALGNYNIDNGGVVIVGSGTYSAPANCFRITDTGVYANGSYNATGADYAELFEWLDGNPRNEDRIGLFVTLDGEKVRLAKPGDDFILGVVSGNPSVVGDAYDDQWQGMYATDIFGRFIYEDAVIPAEYDEDGNLISEEHTETRLKINPAYNANEPYVPRSQRREWVTVGMMGKLTVIDDGTCQVNGWCTVGAGGVATASDNRTKYRVMSRLDGNHVRVLIL